MAIVSETIRVVVSGANPQTKNFTVQIDTSTGAATAPLTIPLTGVNAGTDTVQAYLDSHSLSSNQSTLAWQATNGSLANGPITIDVYNNSGRVMGWAGGLFSGAGSFGNTYPQLNAAPGANSLVINQWLNGYPITGTPCFPNNAGSCGGYKMCPAIVVNQTATGTYSSSINIAGTSDGAGGNADNGHDHAGYVMDVYGSFVVKTAGTYTLYGIYPDEGSIALWIKGVTVSSVTGSNAGNPFPASSPKFGYSPLCLVQTNMSEASLSNGPICSGYVTFPTAGIYQFEAVFNQHDFQQFSGVNNCYYQIQYLQGVQNQSISNSVTSAGKQPLPVALAAAPPTGVAPTGSLQLTPVGGNTNLVIQGQVTNLTLTIQNVTYTSIPYVPLLEGTTGNMTLTNSGTQYVFPTSNGNAVNTTTAASASGVFSITADNTAIAGLLNVTATGATPAPFLLNYNGGAFNFATPGAQIASSQVTITANDIAWYDAAANNFDLFNRGAGSIAYSFDLDYMVMPSVASVTPGSLSANGIAQAVQITLNHPMSPQQQGRYGTGNTVNISGSLTGGATFGSTFTPILDGQGFLLGWSTSVIPPVSSTNGTITMSLTVNGTLTYLSGNQFVTNTVTYITGPVATINTLGGFVPPVGVSLTTTPASTTLSSTSPTTITGTEYTFDNPSSCTMQFFKVPINPAGASTNIGSPTSSPTAQSTITVGGKTAYQKSYAISYTFPIVTTTVSTGNQINLGFVVTDNTSGLSTTYQSTTTYYQPINLISGGGGGGGGCFTAAVGLETPFGCIEFGSLPKDRPFEIVNKTGTYLAELVVHEDYKGWMLELAPSKLVTLDHLMFLGGDIDELGKLVNDRWCAAEHFYPDAKRVWFEGTVYNLHVKSDVLGDHHYILFNGDVAHNLKAAPTN